MEANKNHIDDFLRDKMQDMHFELNEQHWADAERRLDEEDKKKRPLWLLLFAVVVLVGAGITALTKSGGDKQNRYTKNDVRTEQTSSTNSETNSIQNPQTKDNNSSPVSEENLSSQSEIPNSSNDVENVNTNNASNANAANTSAFTKASDTRRATKSKNINSNKTTEEIAKSSTVTNNARTTEDRNKSKRSKASRADNSKVAATENQSAKPASTSKKAEDVKVQSVANASSTKNNQTKVVNNKNNENAASTDNSNIETVNRTNPNTIATSSESSSEDVVMLGNKRVYRNPEEYQKMNPRYVAGLENYAYTETVIPLGQEKSDSIRNEIAKQNQPIQEAKKTSKPPRADRIYVQEPSSFYMLLGAAGARGYRGNLDATPVWGLSPELGVGYQFSFSDRMSIYLSAFMSYVSHLNIKESGTSVSYSFDRDSTLLSVTRKSLLQLNLPLELAYKIRPKHQLYGGLGVNLNLNSFSLFEDAKANSNKRVFGYMGGIRMLDLTANIGYEYMISRRLNVGIFYQQGFFDITKNDYFNNQHNDINARGGIRLRYKFNK